MAKIEKKIQEEKNETKNVKSITEVFSMLPITFAVVEETKRTSLCPESDIKEIKLEDKRISSEELIGVYKGYNFEGKLLFEYLAKSVNVQYF